VLATKLRVLRAERGLSLQDAEKLTGVTRETLGDLERGRRRPYAQTLAKIAHGYGVGLEELLEEQEEEGKAGAPQDTQDTGRPEDYLDKDEPLLFAQQRADAAEKQLASTAQEYEQLLNKAMEEIDRLKNQVEELKGELLAAYRRSEATKEGR
jgi:transcriptional regulator with XRE-family HTH domain